MMELHKAAEWAKEMGIQMNPNYAYMNDLERGIAFSEKNISYDELYEMSKDLCLVKANENKNNLECSQQDILTINENGELLLCCGVSRNSETYALGNVIDMDLAEIKHRKKEAMIGNLCRRCKDSGYLTWTSSNRLTEEELCLLMGENRVVLHSGYFED